MANNLAKNTLYLTLAAIGQKALAFIYFLLIARIVGVEWTGKYFFALSFTTIFSVFVDFGLNPVLIREIAKDKLKVPKYLNNVFSIKVLMALTTALAATLIANILGYDPLKLFLIYLALFVMVGDSFHLTFYGVFRGLKVLNYEALGIFISEIIIVAFGITSLIIYPSLPLLIIALLLGTLFHIFYILILLKRKAGYLPKWELDWKFLSSTFRIAIPFALAGVSVKVYSYIDSVLLERLAGDMYVGWYSIAYKLTYAFQFIPMAFVAGLYPVLAQHWKENRDKLINTFEQSMRYMMVISVPICFGIWSLADKLVIGFYGHEYFNSILPLQILIFVLFAIFVDFPVGSLLNACDRQAIKTGIMIATMVINVFLNAILIPQYNVVGAAIAGLISFSFMLLAGLYFSRKIIKFSLAKLTLNTFKTAFSGAIMALIIILMKEHIHFAFLIPIGALIYFGVLYLVRGWNLNDIQTLKKMILKRT